MPVVHRVKPIAETIWWHGHLDDVREVALDDAEVRTAFVAGHIGALLCSVKVAEAPWPMNESKRGRRGAAP